MAQFILKYNTLQEARNRSRQEMRRRRGGLAVALTRFAWRIFKHKTTPNLFGCVIRVEKDPETQENIKPTGLTEQEFTRLLNNPFVKIEWRRRRW